ncbi:hypothetical protein BDZ97DRAFT_2000233 [Flammula alnicola]|nr:hypothetical protein BDZ97DRAFT_2000233 [Flammula alnicola]
MATRHLPPASAAPRCVEKPSSRQSAPLSELSPAPDQEEEANGGDAEMAEGEKETAEGKSAEKAPVEAEAKVPTPPAQISITQPEVPTTQPSQPPTPPSTTSNPSEPSALTTPTIATTTPTAMTSTTTTNTVMQDPKVVTILELNVELLKVCVLFQAKGVPNSDPRFQQYSKCLQSNLTWLAAAADQSRQGNQSNMPFPIMDAPPSVGDSSIAERIRQIYGDLPSILAKDIAWRQQMALMAPSSNPAPASSDPSTPGTPVLSSSAHNLKRERTGNTCRRDEQETIPSARLCPMIVNDELRTPESTPYSYTQIARCTVCSLVIFLDGGWTRANGDSGIKRSGKGGRASLSGYQSRGIAWGNLKFDLRFSIVTRPPSTSSNSFARSIDMCSASARLFCKWAEEILWLSRPPGIVGPQAVKTVKAWTNTNTNTLGGSYTTPGTDSKTYTDLETLTRTSVTPNSGLRRPHTSPRSPLASVRNIVALWKERTPASARPGEKSAPGSVSSVSPLNVPAFENDGLYGIRRRVSTPFGVQERPSSVQRLAMSKADPQSWAHPTRNCRVAVLQFV